MKDLLRAAVDRPTIRWHTVRWHTVLLPTTLFPSSDLLKGIVVGWILITVLGSAEINAEPVGSKGLGRAASAADSRRSGAEPPPLGGDSIELDAVVATVNEKPILLSEVRRRLRPPRDVDLATASRDMEIRSVLDALILERLIEEEAKRRQISAGDKEISDYVESVAKRNNLSLDGFKGALRNEGIEFNEYQQQVRIELLKAKLASTVLKEGVTVSDEEVDSYLKDHESRADSGASGLTLRQILVKSEGRSEDDVRQRVEEIEQALESGTPFDEAARTFSDGPQAAQGGLLGTVREEDLSREIFDAIYGLGDKEVSKPVATGQGVQIFQVESREKQPEGDPEKQREQARDALRQEKRGSLLSSYFQNDLHKHHSVDKKI